MLRINLEVTKNAKALEQIDEITVLNEGLTHVDAADEDAEYAYAVYRLGVYQGRIWHQRTHGALELALKAIAACKYKSQATESNKNAI